MQYDDVTILLIEDDLVDQMAVSRAFKSLKVSNKLIKARDGIEGLEILRSTDGISVDKPFVIILDLNMPRMNGVEFLHEIRGDKTLHDAVVFVLTTSNDDQDMTRAYEKNIAGYILKSDFEDTFMRTVAMLEHYWKLVRLPRTLN